MKLRDKKKGEMWMISKEGNIQFYWDELKRKWDTFKGLRECVLNFFFLNHYLFVICCSVKGSLGATVKMLLCDREVTGSSPGSSLLQKCKVRSAYITPLWWDPSPDPRLRGCIVHRAALLFLFMELVNSQTSQVNLQTQLAKHLL